jgi:uncharacterized membrane protein YccC
MTTTEERITRLETLAETTLLAIQQLALQQRNTQTELTNSIQDLVSMMAQLANDATEDRKLITGLQTENRRILERLEQHINNSHGEQP